LEISISLQLWSGESIEAPVDCILVNNRPS
jgi:hypothetical protein